MQGKTYIFVALLFAALTIFLIVQSGSEPIEFIRSFDAEPEPFDRVYVESPEFTQQNISEGVGIVQPATIRYHSEQDALYISDFNGFVVYRYDGDAPEPVIRAGRGNGPGEFINLTDFDVCGDRLWAVDIQRLNIVGFSIENGEPDTEISVPARPLRIVCLNSGFVVQWFGGETLFSAFDHEGNEIAQFGEIIENQQSNVMALNGYLASAPNDHFVYIPAYASLIYQFNISGELINVIKTPDGKPFPSPGRQGARQMAPEFSMMRSGWVDEQYRLYAYTRVEEIDWEDQSVIEVFDLVEGEYLRSLRLPFVTSSAIYLPSEQTIFSQVSLVGVDEWTLEGSGPF